MGGSTKTGVPVLLFYSSGADIVEQAPRSNMQKLRCTTAAAATTTARNRTGTRIPITGLASVISPRCKNKSINTVVLSMINDIIIESLNSLIIQGQE